ncbi:MAG: nucleotide exchange factor GrpE [Beijerinckiaceae bacterium]|nr:nucleotide exchange factor GrpE [Beijerinckiaceae bacterium]
MAASEAAASASAGSQAELMAALEAERNDLKDKLLRTLADMENLRRRTEREVADARAYGVTKLATDMVTVVDNLRRAIESIPSEALGAAEGPFKALIEGVELTERDLLKSLERHGVKKIDPKGEKFDPNLHQAMFEAPEPDTPKGHVTQVVQPGFTINGRSLRAALVGVSSGGPKVDKTV